MRGILWIVLLAPGMIWSQITYFPLKTAVDTCVVQLKAGVSSLEVTYKKSASPPANTANLWELQKVALEEADLVIKGVLQPLKEADFYYAVKLLVLAPSNEIIVQDSLNRQPPLQTRVASATNELTFVIRDATEFLLEYGKTYRLVITVRLQGRLDCSQPRPSFSFRKQLPHYLAAGVGMSMIGVGQWLYQERDRQYDLYYNDWRAGKTQAEAEPAYDLAKRREQTAKTLHYVGWAVIGVDALWLTYRAIKIKKKQRLYDTYCSKADLSWQMTPYWENNAVVGTRFSIRF